MPLTTTRPLQPSTISAARTKFSSSRSASSRTARASISRTRRPDASACPASRFPNSVMVVEYNPWAADADSGREKRCARVCLTSSLFPMCARMSLGILELVLLLLAAAVVVVVIFRVLKLPALLGYLLVGVIIGPHSIGLIADNEDTRYLAEFGVVFLMFSIGLEFSLPKLMTMRRMVFGLGFAQVGVTVLVCLAAAFLLGQDWRSGLVLGGVFAMSSTAILAKMLAERLELNTPHGRRIIGILLFQDLAVVPLLILYPTLGLGGEAVARALLIALAKAGIVLFLLLTVGQPLMRHWFTLVARQKSSELFVLNVLFITLGLAWLTGVAGLSLALGAFLAGMLISETQYRYQVEEDIKPFRDVLLGLFFVTVGMRLDLHVLAVDWMWIGLLIVAVMGGKVAIIMALGRLFGAEPGVALRTGLALAGAGEFGVVLVGQAGQLQMVTKAAVEGKL